MHSQVGKANLLQRCDPKSLAALAGVGLKARYLVEGFLSGLHRSPFHGVSVEFSEYRDYHPGDDLRHLDWRLYARSDRLYVKRYTQDTNLRTYLIVDTSGSMAYAGDRAWGTKLEVASAVAAALASLMLRQNDAVGLLTMPTGDAAGEFVQPSQKPSQFATLLQHFDGLAADGGPRLAQLLNYAGRVMHRRSLVVCLSDLLEPAAELSTAFRELSFLGHECVVLQVLDRDELEFPFRDAGVFQDLEDGRKRMVNPANARQKYMQRFQEFMAQHEALLRTLEIPHCVIRSDSDPCAMLSRFLVTRKKRP